MTVFRWRTAFLRDDFRWKEYIRPALGPPRAARRQPCCGNPFATAKITGGRSKEGLMHLSSRFRFGETLAGFCALVCLAAGALACAVLVAGCTNDPDFEPARPAQLPAAAVYAGTERRGDWALCTPGQGNRISCTIYAPNTGKPILEKSLRICPQVSSIGGWEVKTPRPRRFDGQQVTFDDVAAFVDAPDKHIPTPGESAADVVKAQQRSREEYEKYGVTADCTPVRDSKP
jgi:hypothetical protein